MLTLLAVVMLVRGIRALARPCRSTMAEGRSNKAVAERLFITAHTVEKHVQAIFAKLNLPATAADHGRVLVVLTFLNSA